MAGTLIYDPADGSYGLMDAKYDEYWRDNNGNMLCRGLDCLRDCSEQCPIHCNNVAKVLIDKADYNGAITVLKKATEKATDYADNWLTLASCYLHLSMHEEAEDIYFTVLKLDPTNKQAIQELSVVSLRMGKFANAQKYASICGQNKNDAQALEISRLLQQEMLQYINRWPSYNIPDTVWDSVYQSNKSAYWDMVLVEKLSSLAFTESAVSTIEYKRKLQTLMSGIVMLGTSVVKMREALMQKGIQDAKILCVFDVIVAYEKEFIKY